MQTVNIMLDIGGDAGNQIPKRGVTAAEIAVLIAIHGESSVHDIEPADDVPEFEGQRWTNRVERDRLSRIYGRARDGEDNRIVDVLFPGAAARVFATIDELKLPTEFFKATARASVPPPADDDATATEVDDEGIGDMGGESAGGTAGAEKITPPAFESDALFA